MRNAGTVEFRGRKIPVQVVGRQVYISGYPAEQYPRELRSRAIALARSPVAVSMVAVKTTPARAFVAEFSPQ